MKPIAVHSRNTPIHARLTLAYGIVVCRVFNKKLCRGRKGEKQTKPCVWLILEFGPAGCVARIGVWSLRKCSTSVGATAWEFTVQWGWSTPPDDCYKHSYSAKSAEYLSPRIDILMVLPQASSFCSFTHTKTYPTSLHPYTLNALIWWVLSRLWLAWVYLWGRTRPPNG